MLSEQKEGNEQRKKRRNGPKKEACKALAENGEVSINTTLLWELLEEAVSNNDLRLKQLV